MAEWHPHRNHAPGRSMGIAMGRDVRRKNARNRERYAWYKDRGICTSCGRVWAEPGHVRCKACEAKITACHDRKREQRVIAKQEQRRQRIEAGLCTECGKRPASEGMRMCPRCRAMRNDSTRKYKIQKRIAREADEARRRSKDGRKTDPV